MGMECSEPQRDPPLSSKEIQAACKASGASQETLHQCLRAMSYYFMQDLILQQLSFMKKKIEETSVNTELRELLTTSKKDLSNKKEFAQKIMNYFDAQMTVVGTWEQFIDSKMGQYEKGKIAQQQQMKKQFSYLYQQLALKKPQKQMVLDREVQQNSQSHNKRNLKPAVETNFSKKPGKSGRVNPKPLKQEKRNSKKGSQPMHERKNVYSIKEEHTPSQRHSKSDVSSEQKYKAEVMPEEQNQDKSSLPTGITSNLQELKELKDSNNFLNARITQLQQQIRIYQNQKIKSIATYNSTILEIKKKLSFLICQITQKNIKISNLFNDVPEHKIDQLFDKECKKSPVRIMKMTITNSELAEHFTKVQEALKQTDSNLLKISNKFSDLKVEFNEVHQKKLSVSDRQKYSNGSHQNQQIQYLQSTIQSMKNQKLTCISKFKLQIDFLKQANRKLQEQKAQLMEELKIKGLNIDASMSSYLQNAGKKDRDISEFLFDSRALKFGSRKEQIENRKFIMNCLHRQNVKGERVFVFDKINPNHFKDYIRNKGQLLIISRLQNGVIIGGYTPKPFETREQAQCFLFSIHPDQSNSDKKRHYHLVSQPGKVAVNDEEHFLTFGQSQLRLKTKNSVGYSNVGGMASIFYSSDKSYVSFEQFIGSANRNFSMQHFQIYQIQQE